MEILGVCAPEAAPDREVDAAISERGQSGGAGEMEAMREWVRSVFLDYSFSSAYVTVGTETHANRARFRS